MEYILDLKIFEINKAIKLPIASNPKTVVDCSIGDFIVCFDGKHVYAKDHDNSGKESFVLLLIGLDFIEANHKYFNHF